MNALVNAVVNAERHMCERALSFSKFAHDHESRGVEVKTLIRSSRFSVPAFSRVASEYKQAFTLSGQGVG